MEDLSARNIKKNHIKIVVAEGRVTLEELHKALDVAVAQMVPKGGCNCGLTGFDLTFLRGDPAFGRVLREVPHIESVLVENEILQR
ncbi:hypothetical protein GTP41_14750 [Pseudoduganella sp. DS3]|uniref:Uncharacterized protein n=1 Tax=Pseudoduganella guangdongensis TaxID=2692179 RepID=A0A6N9HJY7_9BURK|nr:hypothetical protein [Pseudoduganella guangdongensis]MYN03352.1 hypothetical protein [Pseudoduganella guangdongensis]